MNLHAALPAQCESIPHLFPRAVSDNFEFPVQASVIPWLRACARRNGIAIEPVGQ
jgi:hypothetical protein